jgi:hypothetical protein
MAATITAPAEATELKANVAQSVTITGDDGAYDLVIGDEVRGTLTVSGGTGMGDLTPTADDIGSTEIAVRDSGQGTDLDTLAVTAVRWRYLYEFFTPANVLWYLSPRVNLSETGGKITALGAVDGNGDALAAKDIAQATDVNRFALTASDLDFAGLPCAFADVGNQWLGNADQDNNAYPVCRIVIGRKGTSTNAVYMLGGSTTAATSCAILAPSAQPNWAVYNGIVLNTGIAASVQQPAILMGVFDTSASYLRQHLRDGTDETSTPASAGTGGLKGNTWAAALNSGSGATPNALTKIHEECTLSAVPTSEQIDELIADWTTRGWLTTPLPRSTMGAAVKVIDTAIYSAWPYSNLHHDSVRGITWLLYTQGSGHSATDKTLYWHEIDTGTDTLGPPITAAEPKPGLGVTCHSSGICPNGDYIVFARYSATSGVDHIDVMRSTDGGQTWVNEGEVSTPGGQTIKEAHPPQGSVQGWLATQSGRIICGYRDFAGDNECDLIYSDDNGATWTHVTLDNGGIFNTEPLEPAFWQHPGPGPFEGRIVALIRPGNNGNIIEPLFSYSDDDGLTWEPFVALPGYQNFYNPSAIVYHAEVNTVEIFMGSRRGVDPGIWQMVATPDQFAQGVLGEATKIFTMATTKDAGYPAACRVGNKVYLSWYDGDSEDTDIWLSVGTAPTEPGVMSGTVEASASLTGTLTGLANMSGDIAAAASLAGALTASGNMSGAISAGATVTGTLDSLVGYTIPVGHPRESRAAPESRLSIA